MLSATMHGQLATTDHSKKQISLALRPPSTSNRCTLQDCKLPKEQLPTYDRASVSVGIVHFGVGSFHRSHQAAVVDQLLREDFEDAKEWGICGVGVLPADAKMRDVMRKQDGLYTLLEKTPEGSGDVRVIGSIVEYLFAPEEGDAVLERMADPAMRIVSLTITEGGHVTFAW